MVELWLSFSMWLCGAIEGSLSHFCHARSGWIGRVWTAWEKSLAKLCYDWELNPGHGEDRQWDTFIFLLSYHDWHGVAQLQHSYRIGLQVPWYSHATSDLKTIIIVITEHDSKTILQFQKINLAQWNSPPIKGLSRYISRTAKIELAISALKSLAIFWVIQLQKHRLELVVHQLHGIGSNASTD